ncbi:MAG: STAS domain-containing protein [Thiohalomonadales bacterium]
MKKKQGLKKSKTTEIFEEESRKGLPNENGSAGEIIDDSTLDEQLVTESEDELEKDLEKTTTGGGKMIVLSTVNSISDVGKLHDQWQEHLSGPIMVIEASAVERLDTSVLQLLCALIKDADDNGIDVEWKEPSEKFKHAVKVLGLKGPLKLH